MNVTTTCDDSGVLGVRGRPGTEFDDDPSLTTTCDDSGVRRVRGRPGTEFDDDL